MAAKKSKRRGKKKVRPIQALPVIRANSAGIDLGSQEHWVCGPPRGDGKANVEQFATTTPQLCRLAEWLIEQGVESVAMESTGVYWIPLYELLESRGLEVVLVNARHLRGCRAENRHDRLPVDPTVTQLRVVAGLLPAGRKDLCASCVAASNG